MEQGNKSPDGIKKTLFSQMVIIPESIIHDSMVINVTEDQMTHIKQAIKSDIFQSVIGPVFGKDSLAAFQRYVPPVMVYSPTLREDVVIQGPYFAALIITSDIQRSL